MIKALLKVDYRPLEYIEVQQGKPLNVLIEPGLVLTFHLQTIKDFIYFNENYKILFNLIERVNDMAIPNKDQVKIAYFIKLIELLFDMVKSQYGFFARRRLLKRMKLILLNDITRLIDIYDNILRYNSEVKKKLSRLQSFDIWGGNASWTIGGRPLSAFTRTNEKGEKYLIPRFLLN